MAFIPHGEPTRLNLKFSLNVSQIIIQTLLNVFLEEECNGIQLCSWKSRGEVVTFLKFSVLECELFSQTCTLKWRKEINEVFRFKILVNLVIRGDNSCLSGEKVFSPHERSSSEFCMMLSTI